MSTDANKVEMASFASGIFCLLLILHGAVCVITFILLFFTTEKDGPSVWRFFCDITTLFFLAYIAYHVGRWRNVI